MNNREKSLKFVVQAHKGQVRKYTGERYFHHLVRVARKADSFTPFGYEIGMLHDIFEDTNVSMQQLFAVLTDCEYDSGDSNIIIQAVYDLTDKFTSKLFPHKNRRERTMLEAKRFETATQEVVAVKFCDVIDNLSGIARLDAKFAKVYLEEKKILVDKFPIYNGLAPLKKEFDLVVAREKNVLYV